MLRFYFRLIIGSGKPRAFSTVLDGDHTCVEVFIRLAESPISVQGDVTAGPVLGTLHVSANRSRQRSGYLLLDSTSPQVSCHSQKRGCHGLPLLDVDPAQKDINWDRGRIDHKSTGKKCRLSIRGERISTTHFRDDLACEPDIHGRHL